MYSAIRDGHLSFLLCLAEVTSYRHLKLPSTLFTTSLWVICLEERAFTAAGNAAWKIADTSLVLNFSPAIHDSSELRVEAACCKCQSTLKWVKSTWYRVALPKHAAWNDSISRRALNVSGCTTIRDATLENNSSSVWLTYVENVRGLLNALACSNAKRAAHSSNFYVSMPEKEQEGAHSSKKKKKIIIWQAVLLIKWWAAYSKEMGMRDALLNHDNIFNGILRIRWGKRDDGVPPQSWVIHGKQCIRSHS